MYTTKNHLQPEHIVLPEEKVESRQGAGYSQDYADEDRQSPFSQVSSSTEVDPAGLCHHQEEKQRKIRQRLVRARRRQVRGLEQAHAELANGEHTEVEGVQIHEDLVGQRGVGDGGHFAAETSVSRLTMMRTSVARCLWL